jgi:transposase InsO family protein
MCDVLEVCRSGYYKWLKSGVTERKRKREVLLQRIIEIFEESRHTYGGSLKAELVHRVNFATRIEACTALFDYIEIFYNKRRLHSVLGYLTPWEKVQKGRKVA